MGSGLRELPSDDEPLVQLKGSDTLVVALSAASAEAGKRPSTTLGDVVVLEQHQSAVGGVQSDCAL